MYKKFDSHTHVYPPEIVEKATHNLGKFYDFTVDSYGTLDDLENNGTEETADPVATEEFKIHNNPIPPQRPIPDMDNSDSKSSEVPEEFSDEIVDFDNLTVPTKVTYKMGREKRTYFKLTFKY